MVNQPDIIIPPWEMFFVGNTNKTTPTTNTLTYNEDLFNNNTLLYTENLLFLGNTPPKTITCWIKINPNNKNTVILGESSISKVDFYICP